MLVFMEGRSQAPEKTAIRNATAKMLACGATEEETKEGR
jgi:hypothetical protein